MTPSPGLDDDLTAREAALTAQIDALLAELNALRPSTASTRYPPGLIGVLSTDLARWTWFSEALMCLERPRGCHLAWQKGLWIPYAVNQLVEQLRPEDEWICILSDDLVFPADLLVRMLDHQLPLVAPLVNLRAIPFQPSIFHDYGEEGGKAHYVGWTLEDLDPLEGVIPVDTFGGPGCTIRREVLETLGQPFFRMHPGEDVVPFEDLYSFSRCRRAGFQPHVDLETSIIHCMPAGTRLVRGEDRKWLVELWSHQTLGYMRPQLATDPESYLAYT